ncbi:MAG TPA: hypothetical protein VGK30_13575, partial [Candidatus Binatia bacterium]
MNPVDVPLLIVASCRPPQTPGLRAHTKEIAAMLSRSTFLIAAATAFTLALAVSTASLASQTDQEKVQKENDKIGKLHCFCTDPGSVAGGVGRLDQTSNEVATASAFHTYLGL